MDEEKNIEETPTEDIPTVPEDWAYPKIYQPTITLGNGTKLNGMVTKLSFSNKIWLLLEDRSYSYAQIVTMFTDPENTKVIRFANSSSERTEYLGYTTLSTINAEADGRFNIALSKPDM